MAADDVTLGELVRVVQRLERGQVDTNRKLDELPQKLDATYARKELTEEQFSSVGFRVGALESWRVWITRATVTNFLYPIIGGIIVAVILTVVLNGRTP